SLGALTYGTTPIMARWALEHSGPTSGIAGGLIAYGAATVLMSGALLWPSSRRSVASLKPENLRWFVYSGLAVAVAQAFFYSAVALAPIMLVTPLMQLSLVFRLGFSMWINPDHEIFGALVIAGSLISILGACLVSIDTGAILGALAAPESVTRVLGWR